ncbi:MAG: transposase, partial [Deltaproteobacteria bacterium]
MEFESFEDKINVLKLMRSFSSCMRFAYQRLLEGWKRKDLKRALQEIFPLNSRYCDDAISKAKDMLTSCKKRDINPVKIIFGGKDLFKRLKKNHLHGKKREKLKRRWIEKRQGMVCSRGDKSKKGNLNLRSIFIKGELYLRINTGKGKYIYAKVYRRIQKGRREKDKWLWFVQDLLTAETTRCYKPYFVELKLKDNNVYAMISFEENIPDI